MRRFLPAAVIALLALAVATPVNAGYLIIRVLLDGSGSAGSESTTPGMGMPMGGGPTGIAPPMGSGLGPPGGVGKPPTIGMPGHPGGGTTPTKPTGPIDPTRSLVVVIPVEEDLTLNTTFYPGNFNHYTNPHTKAKLHLQLRGQTLVTNLFTDSSTIQWYNTLMESPAYRRTRAMDVHDKHAKWAKTKTDSKQLYDLIVTALQIGLVDDAVSYSNELLTAVGEKQDGVVPEIATFVRAYGAMQKGITGLPAKQNQAAGRWRSKLGASNEARSAHYILLYWDTSESDAQRRLAMLEENFKAFYLTHALRGVELPFPETPLIAVLPKRAIDVRPLARALDVPAHLTVDGFYAPEHDLLVLAPARLDDMGQTFIRQAQQSYQGVSSETLLAGKGPKIHIDGKKDEKKQDEVVKKPDEVAWMQTTALVDRLLDEDSAIAATSREGSRQLLHATGQLPRFVALPEWFTSASVNYFARPRDPAFVTNPEGKWLMTITTTNGYGAPNYVLQRYFRDLLDKKELNPDRAELLKNILSDAYFLGLREPKEANDPDPAKEDKSGIAVSSGGSPTTPMGGSPFGGFPMGLGKPPMGGSALGPPMGGAIGDGPMGTGPHAQPTQTADDPATKLRKKRERLAIKAQATSWALYYYLAKDRPAELRKFIEELAVLPRDLPLDSVTVTAAFCKAFNLDASNKESLRRFADRWIDYMGTVAPAGIDIPLVDPKPPTPANTGNPMNPMGGGPMFPGGMGSGPKD